jgi:hypothetical protein
MGKLPEYLNGIHENNTDSTIQAILSRQHESEIVLMRLKQHKLNKFRLKYLDFIATANQAEVSFK